MTEAQSEQTRATLARLYDNPDGRVEDLVALNPDETTTTAQATVFQALGNQDRLKLLAALRDGEKCACELQVVLDAPQSTVSTHISKLRDAGVIQRRRKGKWSYYRLNDSAFLDILAIATNLPGEQ